jgi:hypothetical protein
MADPTASQPAPDGTGDDPQLGLSLSELLGEIWSPVSRQAVGDAVTAMAPGARLDPEAGEPSTWNL